MKRKTNLATTTSITSTYAGEFAGEYIAAALFSARTLETNSITIRPNIKYKSTVKRLSNTGAITDQTCAFTPTGTVTLDERVLEPKGLQVNEELCKEDFQSDWEAVQMGYSAFDNLPPNFTQFFIANMLGVVADATETSIWQGDAGNTGEFDGFTGLFQADANVIDVDNAAIVIDSTNVIGELEKLYNAIPDKIYGKPDVMIYASANIVRAYQIALGGFGASGLGAAGYKDEGTVTEKPLFYAGIPIVLTYGLPANEMVAAQKSNLWFGTGLLNDQNQVKVLDMADLDGSMNVRFVMRYTGAVQYGYGTEIAYYWDATP